MNFLLRCPICNSTWWSKGIDEDETGGCEIDNPCCPSCLDDDKKPLEVEFDVLSVEPDDAGLELSDYS